MIEGASRVVEMGGQMLMETSSLARRAIKPDTRWYYEIMTQNHIQHWNDIWSVAGTHSHPSLIRPHSWKRDAAMADVLFYSHYRSGVTLERMLRSREQLQPSKAKRIIDDVCVGLTIFHDAGLIHRDMGPDNVLVVDSRGLVMDYEMVRRMNETVGLSTIGNIWWDNNQPAEFFGRRYKTVKAHPTLDVFGVGIIVKAALEKVAASLPGYAEFMQVPRKNTIVREFFGPSMADVVTYATAHLPEERFQTIGAFRQSFDAAFPKELTP